MQQIYSHSFNGLLLHTGDILCTQDGTPDGLLGAFWRQLGRLIPGEIDHCLIYLGPGGRCVESALKGVVIFEMPGEEWIAEPLLAQRSFVDTLVGAAYPLVNHSLPPDEELRIRIGVASYCLKQALAQKGYNFNFFNPCTERSFYCSQLVYKAYLAFGIDLDPLPVSGSQRFIERIVFPEEIWNACPNRRCQVRENSPTE